MKYLAQGLALAGAMALAVPLPAQASDETPQAIERATAAAQDAQEDMLDTFGKAHLQNGAYLWKDGADEVTHVVVSLSDQLAYAYDGDDLVRDGCGSTARKGYTTPAGEIAVRGAER